MLVEELNLALTGLESCIARTNVAVEKATVSEDSGAPECTSGACSDGLAQEETVWHKMLRRENAIRLSQTTQDAFHAAESSGEADWLYVAEDVQKQVLEEFGMAANAENLLTYRKKALENPELVHYVKFNRARQGTLKVGSEAPNVPVVTTAFGQRVVPLLDEYQDMGKPLVVCAGSWS